MIQSYPLSSLKTIRDNFLAELVAASQGKKTSLAFIKTPLPQKSLVKNDQVAQIMVIGGAVFKKALISFKDGKVKKIEKIEKKNLPLFKTKEIFFNFFENQLHPKINIVALNFAFALKPLLRQNLLDGQLIASSKEHLFNGLINKIIGQELENYIFQKQKRKIKVTVANDTICLLLSIFSEKKYLPSWRRPHSRWLITVAGIVGTGTNFAFFLDEKTAVNLESGNFDKFPQTETGKIIDKNSLTPGKYLFEKEVSGAYLYQHYNLLKHQSEKNFSPILSSPLSSTRQLSALAKSKNKWSSLAQKLLERSASLIACQIAGIYLFKKAIDGDLQASEGICLKQNQKTQTKQQVSINFHYIMEGSLFWSGWNYKKTVEKYLKKLIVPKEKIIFLKINRSPILGAVKLIDN